MAEVGAVTREAGMTAGPAEQAAPAPPVIETDPDIPASMDVPAHVAWSRVMGEVQYIAKANKTEQGTRYNYRGVDLVMDAVAPAIRKHGVIVIPVKVAAEYTVISTKNNTAMNYCRAAVTFAVLGPRGDTLMIPHSETGQMVALLGESIGEGFDTGDKSSMKAQSVALREFYIKALAIPVNRPAADPEHGPQHEIAGPQRPTPEQYAAEILDERTPMDRLSMIKQELYGDRSLGSAEVELADGEKVRLVDLVFRVGQKRTAREG